MYVCQQEKKRTIWTIGWNKYSKSPRCESWVQKITLTTKKYRKGRKFELLIQTSTEKSKIWTMDLNKFRKNRKFEVWFKQVQEKLKMRSMDSNEFRKSPRCELWIQKSKRKPEMQSIGKAQNSNYWFKQV